MITRRRYNIAVKKKHLPKSDRTEVRIGGLPGGRESLQLRAPEQLPQRDWWQDWKSITVVIGLVFAVSFSLYALKSKDRRQDTYESSGGSGAATAKPSPVVGNTPSRRNAGSRAGGSESSGALAGSSFDPQTSTAESFLAFSHGQKAASGSGASPSGRGAGGGSDGGGSLPASTMFEDNKKVALPDNVSGECSIGGGNGLLGGLGNCFKSHGARRVE